MNQEGMEMSGRTAAGLETTLHVFTAEERNTVVAALRHWQETRMTEEGSRSPDLDDIATNGGLSEALTSDEVDELCQNICLAGGIDDGIVTISLDGGLVQGVDTTHEALIGFGAVVVDYDVESAADDDDKVGMVQNPDGTMTKAAFGWHKICRQEVELVATAPDDNKIPVNDASGAAGIPN